MRQPLLFVLLLLLAGCLEFDAQEITIVYDAKADRIDMHVVYRGLFAESGSGSTDKPMQKALDDLAKVRERGSVYFWNNWPLSVDLGGLKGPTAALAAHVDIENGTLFTDASGVLCGSQFVRIRDAKAFLQKLNTMLEIAVQAVSTEPLDGFGGKHQIDDDTREILTEFFRRGQRLLLVEPGRIEVRLPCSDADHAWLKGQLEQRFAVNVRGEIRRSTEVAARRADGGDPIDTTVADKPSQIGSDQLDAVMRRTPTFRFFWDNEGSFVREEGLTRVAIGVKNAPSMRIVKASNGLYHDGLLKQLRDKGETIEDGVTDATLAQRFEQFHGRDAVLPPALAALRPTAKAEPATTTK